MHIQAYDQKGFLTNGIFQVLLDIPCLTLLLFWSQQCLDAPFLVTSILHISQLIFFIGFPASSSSNCHLECKLARLGCRGLLLQAICQLLLQHIPYRKAALCLVHFFGCC